MIEFEIEHENGNMIKVFVYEKFSECFKQMHGMSSKMVQWYEDGSTKLVQRKNLMRRYRNMGYYGFISWKNEMHLWFDNSCDISDMVGLIAHELGHIERPYHKDRSEEEKKAGKFAAVAKSATTLSVRILQEKGIL